MMAQRANALAKSKSRCLECSTGDGFRFSGIRATLVLVLLAAGGCQLFERRPAPEAPPAEPAPPAQEPSQRQQPAARADLSAAIAYLERGEEEQARTVLVELREQEPESELVQRLLRQIDAPVAELLPGPYKQVEVGPGDSLALIAGRELGDPLRFYALARLNGIASPAYIPVGTLLRVPDSAQAQSAASGTSASAAGASLADVESVAAHLARSGQIEQARRLLLDRLAQADVAPAASQRRLVDLTLAAVANDDADDPAFGQAVASVDEALAVVTSADQRARLAATRSKLRSRDLYRRAVDLQARGDLPAAQVAAAEAAALDPAAEDAQQLAQRLNREMVDSLHARALVAWRDRNVDLAIRHWEALLEIEPDFEPARIYLDRARSLRLRLDEP